MRNILRLDLENTTMITTIGKALSSPDRIRILQLLNENRYSIQQIAERLNLAPSSCGVHIKVLKDAGLIRTEVLPGAHGSMKLCYLEVKNLDVAFAKDDKVNTNKEEYDMPIGNYTDFNIVKFCGVGNERGIIGGVNTVSSYYHPDRTQARVMWFMDGYVEYRFPYNVNITTPINKLELSLEVYKINLQDGRDSDITVWINGIEAGSWEKQQKMEVQKGKFTPAWWKEQPVQRGLLKTWSINKYGTYLDDKMINHNGIDRYALYDEKFITVRIGLKNTRKLQSGMFLFGKEFGDYNQGIRLIIYHN